MSKTLELIQNEFLNNDLARKCGYGIVGAAVISGAFFIGYQAAKRKTRLYVRDTEKNDEVNIDS